MPSDSEEDESNKTTISIVAISDTHSQHSKIKFESTADILIHTGDLTQRGTKDELESVIDWLASLAFQHKIVIAGNHDIGLDKLCDHRARTRRPYPTAKQTDELISFMKKNRIIYLTPDRPTAQIDIRGSVLRVYGLPHSPLFLGPAAFMRDRKEDTWVNVTTSKSYDILLSHSPPRGILDQTRRGANVGCHHFLAAVKRVKPQAAIFGHIHEARGMERVKWDDGTSTLFCNAANMSLNGTIHPPIYFNIGIPESKNFNKDTVSKKALSFLLSSL
jgi:predicted MPP superfamily phosphohydrolase